MYKIWFLLTYVLNNNRKTVQKISKCSSRQLQQNDIKIRFVDPVVSI